VIEVTIDGDEKSVVDKEFVACGRWDPRLENCETSGYAAFLESFDARLAVTPNHAACVRRQSERF
jgi:hypothetical protein